MEFKIMHQQQERLLSFFKVMGNADRVKISAVLLDHPATLRDLVAKFGLKEPTLLEHLAALRSLNLVTATIQDQQTIYAFDHKALYALNREMLSRENQPTAVDTLENNDDRKILQNFFEGDRLVIIPEGRKKFHVLLNWLITQFEEGVHYTEKQVNEIIMRYNEDYATLRRGLIDAQLMERDHGVYWRVS
jgi:hypothetical protein